MDLGLAGKTALVTGASQGIGRAVAHGLAAEGARVVMNGRNEATLAASVEAVRLAGGEAFAAPGDVSDGAQIAALFARCRQLAGDPEVLIVNAGGPPPGLPTALDDAAWRKGFELTLMSAVRLAREALPAMREAGWGRIINITSLSVREPIPTLTLSNAFRAAVTGFAKTLSTEVARDGVTVNNVAPGYTATERLKELFPDDASQQALAERIPARRLATPDEVAAVAVFVASQQAAYVTGQTLLVDGGAVGSLF